MPGFSARIVRMIACFAARRRRWIRAQSRPESRPAPHSAADCVPPVLGPDDLWIGMFADRSAGWYLDRR